MDKIIYNLKNLVRKITPLSLRIKGGKILSYINYIYRVNINKNSWKPKVLNMKDTVDLINKEDLSVIRFGDGEISLIESEDLGFQKTNSILRDELRKVIRTDNSKMLICVPDFWGKLDKYTDLSFWFELHHLFRYGYVWKTLLNTNQIYGDALFTRPYLTFKDKSHSKEIFDNIKKIWEDKDVVLIEGEKSRLGVGNDLFKNVKSIKRILCPSENAYSKIEDIQKEAEKIENNKLILVSLGPTAKVLALNLFNKGYRVIDIGHIDMEYEMFLRGAEKLEKVDGKYFNELNERDPSECTDSKYLSEIIAKII